jgi:hypothetical protein
MTATGVDMDHLTQAIADADQYLNSAPKDSLVGEIRQGNLAVASLLKGLLFEISALRREICELRRD